MDSRVSELEALVRHHQECYYNGEPEISDAEFDLLWDELRRIAPERAVFSDVGVDRADGYPKRAHLMPMGSQDKAADPWAFRKWAARVGHERYIVQHKMDGASLELQYREGRLTYGVTRGDGAVGDDITRNARKMQGIVHDLPGRFTGSVRGEVVMSKATHREKYSDKANTRNAANGLMKRKDGVGTEDLIVICYDAVTATAAGSSFDTEIAKLEWLERAGFRVVQHRIFVDPEEVIAYRAQVAARRDELEFDIDGLVVKGPEIDPQDMRRSRPEKQIAFKFELEEAASTLLEVIWNPSGSLYTPIGVMEPVRLAGTMVKRANLVNPRLIREMDLRIGSRVAVTKRGEIIPKIERLLENPEGARPIEQPTICEKCSTPLVDDDTRLYCPNQACPKRALFRLGRWLDVLDIRDFGDVILGKLFDAGRVRTIADLYRLDIDALVDFERMGETLARKILRNMTQVREIPLARFVAGFNIEGVGELIMAKAVDAGYDTLEKLLATTADEFAAVPGIGEITGTTIVNGLAQLRGEMEAVLAVGTVKIQGATAGTLSDVSFCFTGALNSIARNEAEELVRRDGGTTRNSVTKDLTYLVTNSPDSGSGKAKKAQELGISTLSEEEFLALVRREK
ncbi:MAG: NAD-dependent DNA ligase LigA [Spirochaetales bacterium]|nr:NAD-dependent DNA ligase LigA [Spirochaetales bacterium]